LHHQLAKETSTGDAPGLRGWGLTLERARLLLSPELSRATAESLLGLQQTLGRKLFIAGAQSAEPSSFTHRFLALCATFFLTPEERQILLLSLAPELDGGFARVIGFLNDDLTRRRPSAALISQVLAQPSLSGWEVRRRLSDEFALGRSGLVTVDPLDNLPGSEAGVTPSPEVVRFLLAGPGRVPEYAPWLALLAPDGKPSSVSTAELRQRLSSWNEAKASRGGAPVLQLVGNAATLQWFQQAAIELPRAVLVLDLASLDEAAAARLLDLALGAARVAALHDAILLVVGRAGLPAPRLEHFDAIVLPALQRRVTQLVVHGEAMWMLKTTSDVHLIERESLGVAQRAAIWQDRARRLGVPLLAPDALALASVTNFGEPEMDASLRLCRHGAHDLPALRATARRVAHASAPGTVRRVKAHFQWDDLVLPEAVVKQLRHIPLQVRRAGQVLDDWGYRSRMPYGHGLVALFSGPSGTGKTMAAQVIASELGSELFQVDLSKTVSKYIGETEKNLDAVFDAAERASAVLLFDEADALFGKRTEVRDARDRYANVEVSYLLQRMEAYAGLALLTTNFRQNLDRAFLRRLRVVVDFPQPDVAAREAIWRRVFPTGAPLADDVRFDFLARRLELSGGPIQQIAVRAAFWAAAEGDRIAMRHVLQATSEELTKLGMINEAKALASVAA
jgi:hypothetical protein